MNEIVKMTVDGYLSGFAQYEITQAGLQAEVDDFKARVIAFGEQCTNPMTFASDFMASGLQEEYSSLISKVYMADQLNCMQTDECNNVTKADNKPIEVGTKEELPTISVHDYLYQYKSAYETIANDPTRPRAQAAYQALFDVENRTDDMLEAQIIMEKERLLWRIVAEDGIDIMSNRLAQCDPLQKATTIALQIELEAFQKSDSDEELRYRISSRDLEKDATIAQATTRMNIAICLADLLVKYCKARVDVYEWRSDSLAQGGIAAMVSLKAAIRRVLSFMKYEMGITFDELISDEGSAIWMLVPQTIDDLGKIKSVLDPYNFEVYADIIHNEIEPDISIVCALQRIDALSFHFDA